MTPERVREIWYSTNPSGIALPDACKAIAAESQRELAAAVLAEREACAKAVGELANPGFQGPVATAFYLIRGDAEVAIRRRSTETWSK